MKKFLLTLMLAVMAMVIHAATFDNGDFTYTIISDNTCNLVGYSSSANTTQTSITIPGYVWNSTQQKRYQVTAIVSQAFAGNQYLQNVTINYGVKNIGNNAFYNCQNLTWVHLPSSVISIGSYAFFLTRLQNVYCGCETMPSIHSTAFTGLQSTGTRRWYAPSRAGHTAASNNSIITADFTVNWDPGLACDIMGNIGTNYSTLCTGYFLVTEPTSDPNSFSVDGVGKCKLLYANPGSGNTSATLKFGYNQEASKDDISYYVTEIADYAFYNTSTMKVLDMSETNKCEKIGYQAFYNSALTSAIISAQTVDDAAFWHCSNLSSVRLYGSSESATQGVKSVGAQCFMGTAVSSVYIPSTLTTYGIGAFCDCDNLTAFTVSSSNPSFAAYNNALYNKDYSILYQYPAGRNAYYFDEQAHLSLKSIRTYSFYGNDVTSRLVIPYGVTSIGAYAFRDMSALQLLRIPSSVTSFQATSFMYLPNLRNFYFNIKTIPSTLTDLSAFTGIRSGCKLHIPRQRTNHYSSTAPWSTAFTGGIYEDAYDHIITYTTSGALNYELGFTVISTANYMDTKVQSTVVDGQMSITYGYVGVEGGFTGNLNLPNTVNLRGKTYIVSEVDREVFRDQTLIQRVTGGDGIKKIGALSFAGLTGCTVGFYLHNPVEFCDSALFNCKTPVIELGDRLQRIGNDAFRGSRVREVLMPPSVTSIGSRFIAGDTNLDTLRLSPNITQIPMHGLGWVNTRYIVIPYGVKTIAKQAFFSDKALIGSGEYLYEINCENVVVIPSSVTYIDPDAFTYARHLDDIYLNCPYGVFKTTNKYNWQRRTDYNASNCYDWSGHKLYVPVGQVQQYRNDSGIYAAWAMADIGAGAFDFTTEDDFYNTMYRMTVVDPTAKTAKYVYNWGHNNTQINAVNTKTDHLTGVSYTMVEIGDSCWVNRPTVAAVFFSTNSTITRIGSNAFKDCTGLYGESTIPASVSSIGSRAFYGCYNLSSVFLERTSSTTIGSNMFGSQATNLYVPLNQFYNIANQTVSWLGNVSGSRRLLPYVKPTTEWSAISVPVADDILLPYNGEFYYANGYNPSGSSLNKVQLTNNKGIKGGQGMLLKGTVGTVYRFRRVTEVSNYTYVNPSDNVLKGVSGASQTLRYVSSGPYDYVFNVNKFDKVMSNTTVYSGSAYLRLTASQVPSNVATVYIEDNTTYYNLWIAGVQVTSENCTNLSSISGVSGTVTYKPATNTLSLNNATIQCSGVEAIRNGIAGLKITLTGNSTLTVTSGSYPALFIRESTTISGTGQIVATSLAYMGCSVLGGKTLTISGGAQVGFAGQTYGLYGHNSSCYLVMSGANSKLIALGNSFASIYRMHPTLNDGLTVTSPAGASFNSSGTVVNASGNTIAGSQVIISKQTTLRGDVDGDGIVGIADVTALLDYILTGNSTGLNLTAADVDYDTTVGIADATAIIDYILTGHW